MKNVNTAPVEAKPKETPAVVASEVFFLNEGGDMICEYHGCSGDCGCDGD